MSKSTTNDKNTKPIVHISKDIITVKLKDLQPANFQRDIKAHYVEKIANNFQMHKYTYPCVAHAPGGKYWVWDGQHRVAALQLQYSEESTIDVYLDDIGYEEAAREFAEQDMNRQTVTTVQKFKALVEAKDEVSVKVNTIVNRCGLSFGSGAPVVKIAAVKDTVDAYNKLGEQRFEEMLVVMRDGLPKDDNMWKSKMIKAMTKFFEVYVDRKIDSKHLTSVLGGFYLHDELLAAKKVNPRDTVSGLVYCIARAYNKGRRSGARLDANKLLPDNV